jgi:hypothetical protein
MHRPSLFLDYRSDGQAATACDAGPAILKLVGQARRLVVHRGPAQTMLWSGSVTGRLWCFFASGP